MANKTHGMSKSSMYKTWCYMISRCSNPSDSSYLRYGGRGISVCERWLNFENFYYDMGDRPEGMTIDRIDNNKGYCKDNCKWSTGKEQSRNRRSNRMVEFNGQKKCLTEWSEETGIAVKTMWQRINSGWTIDRTLTTPVRLLTKRDK